MIKIELNNSDYTVIFNENPFVFKALRHNEEWRDLVGDNLMLAMVYRISELEEKVTLLQEEIKNKNSFIDMKDTSIKDEIGGVHDEGLGWDPNGKFCGECGSISCVNCKALKEKIML